VENGGYDEIEKLTDPFNNREQKAEETFHELTNFSPNFLKYLSLSQRLQFWTKCAYAIVKATRWP